jgi:hypothetical protein
MRRVRALVVTVVVVFVIAATAVVADHRLRLTAQERLAVSLAASLSADQGVDVAISEGRPFLLQLASGRLDGVTATAAHLRFDGTDVTDVRLEATGVTVRPPYIVADMTTTGTVPTATIQDRLRSGGLDAVVEVAGGDLRATGTVLGLPWDVMLAPAADAGRLTVNATAAHVAGRPVAIGTLPAPIRRAITGVEVPLSGLPQGLAIAGAQVVAAGVELTLTGQDVVLPGS